MSTKQKTSEKLPGHLFVFEGMNSAFKSTLAQGLAEKLRKNKQDVLVLSFPDPDPKMLESSINTIFFNSLFSSDDVSQTSLQLMNIATRINSIEKIILPALTKETTVILDRYWWSTIAYGVLSSIERKILNSIINVEKLAWSGRKPSKLFYIKCDKPTTTELSPKQWKLLSDTYQELFMEEKYSYPIEIIQNTKSINNLIDFVVSNIQNLSVNKTKKVYKTKEQTVLPYYVDKTIKKVNHSHWLPTRTTEVFDTYWRFAAERQSIFFKRIIGVKPPWTKDIVLQYYKFTNAYRASDRVSQFLIQNIIYEGLQEINEIFFRIILFKTFNKIETWQLLVKNLDNILWREFNFKVYDDILTSALLDKRRIYSAAYIMPSGGPNSEHRVKHRNHLLLIQKMMADDLPIKISESKSMQEVFNLLRHYPMIGDFLAYQYAIDINYSILTNFSEMSFVMPGPGAKDGIRKCFSDFGGLTEVDIIRLMADRQEDEFTRLGLKFESLWGRPLQLIDCQNLFCEVDKYARIVHPEIKGITGRSKIKQALKPNEQPISYFYPPKWNINEHVKNTLNVK